MKRSVNILIAASAVAAVFGVGAVSYAKWTAGSGGKPVEVEGVTGSITTIGGITVTPSSPTVLYPLGGAPSGSKDYWEFNVNVTATGDVSVTVEGKFASSGIYAKLYYSQGTDRPTDDDHDISSAKVIEDPTKPVYVYMVAYGTNAMEASINLTFTAKAAT